MPEPIASASAASSLLVRTILGLAGLVLVAGCVLLADWYIGLPDEVSATYVGSPTCAECHQVQADKFHGSYHDLAMDLATDETVLGDFNNAELTHYGITSRMFRRDGKFMINTEGPDGSLQDFEIKYVFGVHPLQQYMVEFDRTEDMLPSELPRVQVLRVSWDSEKNEWFYLRPPDVDEKLSPDDELHWTGVAQRWNTMCADCHSTRLRKNFDPETNRYRTTFAEIDVGCEACHGPGSVHVDLARAPSLFWDRKHGTGLKSLKSTDTKVEIQTCAPCHSRRSVIHQEFRPGENYYNSCVNELLNDSTYFTDGQILDEVYVYGSFIQSKMYHKDIRCSDCHDSHSTRLKHEGNKVCTSCHQHPAGKYDTPAHHHHQDGSPGASCVECHMPETTYMMVDPRRDHSMRIPRPDLSVQLGTPNACTRCHLDRAKLPAAKREKLTQYLDWMLAARGDSEVRDQLREVDQWAQAAAEKWYGAQDVLPPTFAPVLQAAREGSADMPKLLELARQRVEPGIVRATILQAALEHGSDSPGDQVLLAAEAAALLEDKDTQVRLVAIRVLEPQIPLIGSSPLNAQQQQQLEADLRPLVEKLVPLLDDPWRAIRLEAARVLQRVPARLAGGLLNGPQRERLAEVTEELIDSYHLNFDRAAGHMGYALLLESMGRDEDAAAAYRAGMRVEPRTTGPRTNLAALRERQAELLGQRAQQLALSRQRPEAEQLARRASELLVEAAQMRAEELPLLARDARLAPESAVVQYRYGMALYLAGQAAEAEQALRRAYELEPDHEQFVLGLLLFLQRYNRLEEARQLLPKLLELAPHNPSYRQLANELQPPDETP